MSPTANAIINEIVALVVQNITESWIRLNVEIDAREKGVLTVSGHYVRAEDGIEASVLIHPKAVHLMQELRQKTEQEGKEPWSLAELELTRSGQLSLDFRYD